MTFQRELPQLSDPQLLDKIDRLRDLNINQHVALPQLVVVGDQSSGKSSLLESITGIPFPRDQTLCTRHATQISSRRQEDESVNISIIPGSNASEDHRKHLEAFRRTESSSSEFRLHLTDIIKKAHEHMGLRSDLSKGQGAIFSEDVLKVEIKGPQEELLTIIDVPGIFRAAGDGTTKNDIEMVNNLVRRYIKDERTVILAVLPSNVDIATQEILQIAEEFDKDGERTLGILTKPDLVTEKGAQDKVCDLLQGKRRPLNLGYYIVRNRGADDAKVEHYELEQTFRNPPWNQLPHDRVGILALKEQLRALLLEISNREFPKMMVDIDQQLKSCNDELDKLGPPRQNHGQQRTFLSRIAGQFQSHVRSALSADYNASTIFENEDLRLITQVVNITEAFCHEFHERGHSRNFETPRHIQKIADEGWDSEDKSNDAEGEEDLAVLSHIQLILALVDISNVDRCTEQELIELGNIISSPVSVSAPGNNMAKWIKSVYLRSRGLDLGTFNAHLVSAAFAEQSRKWKAITGNYMNRVILTVHRFIKFILSKICRDQDIYQKLWREILTSLLPGYRRALEQVELLIHVDQQKQPYTLNKRFNESLAEIKGQRLMDSLYGTARKDTKQYGEIQYMVNLRDIPGVAKAENNAEHLQQEVHDILQAYYSLARDRYIDNIFQLAVSYHLLHGAGSPLKVFTQDWVLGLDNGDLNRIAGESYTTKRNRNRIKKKISDLEKALNILKEPQGSE
ncbi:dynamin family [Fusarium mexicanum]|uniref:Dynamin family n=1 Tax=Fusarium mexicanum TaxID=751941 RepID=A0A8H5IGJ9_9HYPO|nr:dynamin family [Fusarium mexicanum]